MELKNSKSALALSLYTMVDSINKKKLGNLTSPNKLNIVFITNFGYVVPEEIIPSDFELENIESELNSYLFATALKTVDEKMFDSELKTQCFILKDVEIRTFDNKLSTLANMILFADEIVGLSIGDQQED